MLPKSHPHNMTKTIEFNETLWSAIAEPNRRRLLDLLLDRGESSASKLALGVPFTRQAVAKHMEVLKKAGLIRSKQHGKEIRFAIQSERLHAAAHELSRAAYTWNERLLHIKQIAETLHQATKK